MTSDQLLAAISILCGAIVILWRMQTTSQRDQLAALNKRIQELESQNATLLLQWKEEVKQSSTDAKRFLATLERLQGNSIPPGKTILKK